MFRMVLILALLLIGCEKSEKTLLEPKPETIDITQVEGELMLGTKESGIKLGWCPAGEKPSIVLYKEGEERVQITSDFIHFLKDGRCICEIRPGEARDWENE